MKSIIFHLLLILFLIALDAESARALIGYLYLLQFLFFIYITNKKNSTKKLTPYLKPSFLIITYVCLYFGLGSIYLNGKHGLFQEMVSIYFRVEHFKLINAIFIISNYIVFTIGVIIENRYNGLKIKSTNNKLNKNYKASITGITIFFCLIMFLFFSLVDLDLALIGGVGSFSYIPKVVASIFIFIYLASNKNRFRIFIYVFFLVFFAIISYESKREIIFIIALIVFIENLFNPIKFQLNFRSASFFLFGFVIFIFFILTSSIRRGYGNYNADDILSSVKYIPDYIQSDIFLDAIGDNFELNVVYGNALNSANMHLKGDQDLLMGETFIKVFFLPLPQTIFNYKPRSMIQIYSPMVFINTNKYVTFPVVIYSELLWNFGALFFIFLILIVVFIEVIFHDMLIKFYKYGLSFNTIIVLLGYTIIMQFIRGSGFDLLVLYVIVSIPFIFLIFKLDALFGAKKGNKTIESSNRVQHF